MALSAIDRYAALLVIDLQQGLVSLPAVPEMALPAMDVVVHNASRLTQAFRRQNLPVVLVTVSGSAPGRTERPSPRPDALPAGWTDIIPELNAQAGDLLVTKTTWGAFASTDLERRLKAMQVTQVVVAGIATGSGVESTARQAYELGFNVTLAVDAMTDRRTEAHRYSIANVFPRLGETGTTQAIIDLLESRRPRA
jgi:nicotinamidase-related amidase